ncbi:MAG TPA: glycoside hydrolase family 19 protein [Myxococcaceae bacterium]|jgi:predicted chitinase|nr:glycoside hydrolase family 19 protein [Myxococcaceae bacterium]
MAVSLTPSQLKAICPEAPASAVLSLNAILARTTSITHLRAAMLVAQLAATSDRFRLLEEKDGPRQPSAPFFGRGWIQLTGRRAYREAGDALDLDLLRTPDLARRHNTEVTAWFWNAHRLHAFSDVGDIDGCTRAIAGAGATPERLAIVHALYERACSVLSGAHGLAA